MRQTAAEIRAETEASHERAMAVIEQVEQTMRALHSRPRRQSLRTAIVPDDYTAPDPYAPGLKAMRDKAAQSTAVVASAPETIHTSGVPDGYATALNKENR